ncbi:hypothetical protein [Halarcobacter sp.]|uniref:hypothetical protein n=1 Tax=Halarcobacter sp. TaxID=2321133 RepID=UPI002AA8FF53|nr:hypothetical protein [Halarcobacter sp.]
MSYNSAEELNLNEQIHQIIYLIKNRNDYSNAARIMVENSLSIETLKSKTLKITQLEFAKLADSIIESRG